MPEQAPANNHHTNDDVDPVRERLVDAAAEVFARDGYDGTRIQDIVRTAGLTTGAVYGRFRNKSDLMHEAVVSRATPQVQFSATGAYKVADLVAYGASRVTPGLSQREALLLETYVAARREPEVADAVAAADEGWRHAVAPLVDAAIADGTIADDVDPDAVLFLVRVLRLGLLLHRGSGLDSPDPDGWTDLVNRVVASFGASDQAIPSATSPDSPSESLPSKPSPSKNTSSEGDQL